MFPVYGPATVTWFLMLLLYWGSLPFALALLWWARRRWQRPGAWRRTKALVVVVLAGLFIDARFIEPQLLTVRETRLGLGAPIKVALIADYHLGVYKGRGYLERVVDRLNQLDVDAVLIAGDHTNSPDRPLDELLAPLARLRHPTYSVPGNHDESMPGPPLAKQLRDALIRHGVQPVEGRYLDAGRFIVVGLGDWTAHKDQPIGLRQAPADKPRLVLMHNPDSAMQLRPGSALLALAGHTHCGQVRIPGLYRPMISTIHPFDRGLHTFAPVPTFVTCGLGEVKLPLRFLNPPVIDVLDLR
ncbi:metallophosphoesterase [Caldimonas brevitalea]|uniref:Phosphoesterase n=1 Tax=Caldimonas brevitalea TaxID=413882 RepID=A0A0G3BF63_9BURK|nr:metallophosphoesterase [Caldimonas brevitalea]AKJ27947.1 phosphoesterase [Caldimonas brevitalea]